MRLKQLAIRNFRSIEEMSLTSLGDYLSISGRNNAGKTNVLSALFAALSPTDDDDDEIEFYSAHLRRPRINLKHSLPVWLRDEPESRSRTIRVDVTLGLNPAADRGIIRFLETMTSDLDSSQDVDLAITLVSEPPEYKPVVTASVAGIALDAYRSGEVLRKLRSMGPFYYHNSVEMNQRYAVAQTFRDLVGEALQKRASDLEGEWTALTTKLAPALDDARSELTGLLGRLEDRFSLSLTIQDQIPPHMLPVYVGLQENTRPVPVERWGSGTRNRTLILARVLNAIRRSKDEDDILPIIVVEEPESFLHPSAQADFGRVLQAISRETSVQIIVTTHSPYLLSHQTPQANILLERKMVGDCNQTVVVPVQDEWTRPFELALGISSPELYGLKGVFFGEEDRVIFCEGPTDAEYLKYFRDARHGEHRLRFGGAIYPYGGASKIQNQTLLKFIRDRFGKIVITVDLDLASEVRNDVLKAGFSEGHDFICIGANEPGKKSIEGLVPNSIHASVLSAHPELALAMQEKGDKEAAKSARSRWKSLVLERFLADAVPGSSELQPFYQLIEQLNKACGDAVAECAVQSCTASNAEKNLTG